jgi:LPS-assembly lipoprotein
MRRGRQARRRGVVTAALAALLGGCGFRSLYGTVGDEPDVQARLAEINVLLIPERAGQLLRQALQTRLERGGAGLGRRFDLSVQVAVGSDAIAVQRDSAVSRVRLTATANWRLLALDPQRSTLASGVARQVDGYNIINQQFFAAELTGSAVQRRMMEALADQITGLLAAHFLRELQG